MYCKFKECSIFTNQYLIEGDKFINDATQTVSIALNNPKINKPVATATAELRKFATWRLDKNAETIATLDDYLSNGISDLVSFCNNFYRKIKV